MTFFESVNVCTRFDDPSLINRGDREAFDTPKLVGGEVARAVDEFKGSGERVEVFVNVMSQKVSLVLVLERDESENATIVSLQDRHKEKHAYCVAYDGKDCHWDEWVDREIRSMGVMTLLRTTMEAVEGFLQFETIDTMDRMVFHASRGFVPIAKVPKGKSDDFYRRSNEIPLDNETLNNLGDLTGKFPFGIRMEHDPIRAQAFFSKLIGHTKA